jgi:hypothetical protein
MTWQDNLRQLDARLAKGELSAAEYRRTRDEILAEASSSSQSVSFEPAAEKAGWQSANPAEEQDPDATVVTSVDTSAPERTSDSETTQVVSAADVASTPRPAQAPAQAPVAAPQAPPAPQAHAPQQPARFGPPAPLPQQRSAPIQGQEVFAEARPANGGGSRALRFVIPVLILALIGAGVWWFALRDSGAPAADDEGQRQGQTTSAAQVPAVGEIADRVPRLPGEAKPESGTMTPQQAQQQELLAPAYATLLAEGGANEIVYRKSAGGGFGYLLVAAPVEPSGRAAELAASTGDNLRQSGFAPVAGRDGEPQVISRTDQFFRTYVTTYASGDVWVQVNVSAAPDGDEAALAGEFDEVLRSVLGELPTG